MVGSLETTHEIVMVRATIFGGLSNGSRLKTERFGMVVNFHHFFAGSSFHL